MTNLDEKQNTNFSTEQSQHAPPEFQNNDNGKNKKMSKKKKTILAVSISAAVLLAAAGVFAFSQQGNSPAQVDADTEHVQVEEPKPVEPEHGRNTQGDSPRIGSGTEASQPTPPPEQPRTQFDLEAIKQGDFSSLEGAWENLRHPDRNFVISGNIVTSANGAVDQISTGVRTNPDGSIYLGFVSKGGAGGPAIGIFPAGVHVPVWLADGTIDESGRHDPTDISRDRLFITQTTLPPDMTLEYIFYRV
ncbi:MAG: DUF6287 domain-containing protein [Streptococcaceae bacterium]|jgi:hypothetical protein|nr:DUF6287 domain-containing protein [Streptococcaceae bacterium]